MTPVVATHEMQLVNYTTAEYSQLYIIVLSVNVKLSNTMRLSPGEVDIGDVL